MREKSQTSRQYFYWSWYFVRENDVDHLKLLIGILKYRYQYILMISNYNLTLRRGGLLPLSLYESLDRQVENIPFLACTKCKRSVRDLDWFLSLMTPREIEKHNQHLQLKGIILILNNSWKFSTSNFLRCSVVILSNRHVTRIEKVVN